MELVHWLLLLTGVLFGATATRTSFCVFGSISDYMFIGKTERLKAVGVAMIVFGLVFHVYGIFYGYDLCPLCADVGWGEFPGLHNLIGGVIQGFGYALVAGCPLSILRKTGEGQGVYMIAALGFIIGIVIYAFFLQDIFQLFNPYIYSGVNYLYDLI